MDTVYGNHQDAPADRTGHSAAENGPETLTREQVSELMFQADTLQACEAAWKARAVYLRAHPDDTGILEEGESLWMTEQAIKRIEAHNQTERVA